MKKLYVFSLLLILSACSPKGLSVKWKESGVLSGQVLTSNSTSSLSSQSVDHQLSQPIGQTALKLSATSNQKSISIFDTCTNPTVSLFEVGTDGQKNGAAVGSSTVESDGTYKIKLPFKKLPDDKTYVVEVSGCSENLSRVVTEQNHQDISVGTTLLSSWLPNSDVADKIVTADKSVLKTLLNSVRDTDSYTLAYSTILNNSALNSDFQRVFGVSPTTLRNVAPEKTDLIAPQVMTEGSATTLSMVVKHWSPEYQFAYKWMVDDLVIGTTANVSYIPHANMQGVHTLKVFYGARDGSNELDLSKPYKQKSIAINILNAQPAVVPAVSLTSGSLVNSPTLHIALDTGALRSNCLSFSRIAVKEDVPTSPLLESEFQYTCTTAGTQDLVYNLLGADGTHTLYVWTQDAAGNISATPRTLSVMLDTTNPVISIGSPAAGARVKGLFTLSGTCEAGTNVSIGGTGVTAQSTTCNAGVYSTLASLTSGEASKALTISQTDLAGNSTSVAITVLRDDTAPTPTITSPAHSSSYQSNFTLTGNCSTATGDNQAVSISSTGIIGSPLNAACTSGSFSQSLTLSGTDGLKVITISQLDEAGNSGTASVGVLKDSTPPVINLVAPAANFRTQSGIVLSGSCEDGTISITGDTTSTTMSCSGGSFSQAVSLNGADGSKNISLTQTDAAGNTGTTSRSFLKDTSAPDLNITSPSTNDRFQSMATVSGTCEAGGRLDFTGSDITPITNVTCPGSGNFSQSITLSGVDGAKTFTVEHRDSLNNLTSATVNVIKDNVAPTLTLSSPAALTNTQSSLTLTGACGTVTGDQATITLESTSVDGAPLSVSCTAGAFSQLITLSGSDGTKSVTLKQKDSAQNESSITRSFVKDTTAPTLNITSPNSLASFQNTLTLTGTCETGLPVNISGDASATATACSGSSFSTSITLSVNDGAKLITVSQTDTAGNTGSTTRTFYKDTTAPSITFSSPASGTNIQSMVAISGTCEAGLTVSYSGDISSPSSTSCASGSFSDTVTLTAGQGSKTLTLSQTDPAGNIGTQSLIVTRDNTAPLIAFSSPTSNSSYQNSVTVSGTCGALATDLSSLTLSGPFTGSPLALNCISGNFSSTVSLTGADGLKTLSITQQDQAANSSTANLNLYKDTTAPTLTITSPAANFVTQSSITLTGACETGLTIQITGDAGTSSTSCTASSYSSSLTLSGADGTKTISIAQTDAAGNTSSVTRSFVRDTTAPTLQTFIINNNDAVTLTPLVSVQVAATDTNGVSAIRIAAGSADCQSAYTNDNWITSNGASASYNVSASFSNGEKLLCGWAKDSVGNISVITNNSARGTPLVESDSIILDLGSAPLITQLSVVNNNIASSYYNTTQFNSGDAIKVSFTVTDESALANQPLEIWRTTDGTNFTQVATSSSVGSIGADPKNFTGEYSALTAANSAYFQLKLVARDANGNTSASLSEPLSTGKWSYFAGNNAVGLGEGALSSRLRFNGIWSQKAHATVTSNNTIYIYAQTGLYKVNPLTGNLELYVKVTGSPSNLSGTLSSSSTLSQPGTIFSNGDFLYVTSGTALYEINTTNNAVRLYAGGGTSASATTATGLTLIGWASYAMDPVTKDVYVLNICSEADTSGTTSSASMKLLKLSYDSNTNSLTTVTHIAGNCALGNPVNGAVATASPLMPSTIRSGSSNLVYVPSTGAIYLAGAGARLTKIMNGYLYTESTTGAGWMGGVYNPIQNKVYWVLNGGIQSFTPNSSNGFTETLSALIPYESACASSNCRSEGQSVSSAGVAASFLFNAGSQIGFVDGFKTDGGVGRIRVIDFVSNKVQTVSGTDRFFGDNGDRRLARFASLRQLKYKSTATGPFPAGLYIPDGASGYLLNIPPSSDTIKIVAGSGLPKPGTIANGTTFTVGTSLSRMRSAVDFGTMTLNPLGLFTYFTERYIYNVKSDYTIETFLGNTANNIYTQADGVSGTNYSICNDGGDIRFGMEYDSAGNFYFGGYEPVYCATPRIKIMVRSTAGVYKTVIGTATKAFSADCSTPGCAQSQNLNCGSGDGSGGCWLAPYDNRYSSGAGRLLFSEGNKIRFVSRAYDPSQSTLGTIVDVGRAVGAFSIKYVDPATPSNDAIDRIFYVSSDGKLYCSKISAGADSSCNNTSLGPSFGAETLSSMAITQDDLGALYMTNTSANIIIKYSP